MQFGRSHIYSRANKRLFVIRNLRQFPIPMKELVTLYGQFIRSLLEFNSNVWFSSLTEEESEDLERVQKTVCKILLKEKYTTYQQALADLDIEDLKTRRLKIAIKFGKGCQNIDKMKHLFSKQDDKNYNLRNQDEINVQFASKQRLYKSTIPTLQRLLNTSKT